MSSHGNPEKLKVPYLDLKPAIVPLMPEFTAAIKSVIDSCAFCLGPEVAQFEAEFAEFCGTAHAVGLNSGTSSLHLAMRAHDIGPGHEVITTPYTFAATCWAISYVGAKPVFADIQRDTFNIDPRRIEEKITPRTRAIIPVHLYGQPCDLDPLINIAEKHNLHIVEDAAQAHGASYKGRRTGGFGTMGCFSFYPAKNLGAFGEGGALVTNNAALADRIRSLREHGSSKKYLHEEVGYNYRMEGIQGAVLRIKLAHLQEWNNKRRRIAQRYHEGLSATPLRLPIEQPHSKSAWHLYVIRHPERDKLKAFLENAGIGCGLHYPKPMHLQQCYTSLGHKPGDFPIAEEAANQCLCLPIYPGLNDEMVEYVITTIHRFFADGNSFSGITP
ncbi:MAG: DegT/DnrJ/EryC1/StrS family aminotransferase [Verrucomicrobia bacterium]|nr:DegT/DnrJ/EryC1/StrS family aminotransferase [Verrucomicrobiota bacterium]MCF7708257.1 DegT/DnrJ/EryC1/StrS family aminotransferase [Verrucomicrobiota bacterium]